MSLDTQHGQPLQHTYAALADIDPRVRAMACSRLGKTDLRRQPHVLGRLRTLLLHDPSARVRALAAEVLGRHSHPCDNSLRASLRHETHHVVRLQSFEALLKLAGMPPWTVRVHTERVLAQQIEATLEQAEELIAAWRPGPVWQLNPRVEA